MMEAWRKVYINCANCGKRINEGDECIAVKDNYLLVNYFEKDGYVFCSDDCLKEYLSAYEGYWCDDER